MKKFIKNFVTFVISAVLVTWFMFGNFVKGAMSVKKLDDGIYYIEYKGKDGFDRFLEQGGAKDGYELGAYITRFLSNGFSRVPDIDPQEQDYGCSTLAVSTPEGGRMMGRNFDWQDCLCIISKVTPKGGYKYISSFNPHFFGFGEDWKPEGFANQYLALSTLFVALDGVNEKGLAVADLMVGEGEIHQNAAGKPALTTTCTIKYLLKNAADVEEAVALLEGINHHSDVGSLHHLSISDANGRSVVVEWVGDKMFVTETDIVTNHYLCAEYSGVGKVEGDFRFEKLAAVRDSLGGCMSSSSLLDGMSAAWQSWSDANVVDGGTQWTALFDLTGHSADYIWQRDTTKRFHFTL